MILPDIETKVDLLNAEPIAKTISRLIRSHPGTPITIGVHGDWGAGKSSVLEMVEHDFVEDDKTLCVKFNGWRFQGFEDAKIALLEGLVTELVESRSLATKSSQAVKDIFRRLDLLKIAKNAGGLAFTAFSGIPTLDQIKSAAGILQSLQDVPEKLLSKSAVESAAAILSGALKEPDTKRVPQEVAEFRKEFNQLLELAGVEQLVVLVDDLDRCLPDTAIETLEAIRLFVFTPRTAFVIAADEGMIEYAVRRHFPDLPETTVSRSYAQNYLEKLIHVPFRIPALGTAETRIYVTLLLVGAAIKSNPTAVSKLIEIAREKLRRPWEGASLGPADVKAVLTKIPDDVQRSLNLSEQLGPVLAEATFGNPRQIKRFLNLMLLRLEIATARGIGNEIKGPVLAKLMLLERSHSRVFDQITQVVNRSPTGVCEEIAALERRASDSTPMDAGSKGSGVAAAGTKSASPLVEEWAKSEAIVTWASIPPTLAGIDLRGYFFLTRDRRGQLGAYAVNDRLQELATQLTGADLALAAEDITVKNLPVDQATTVFELLRQKIIGGDSFMTKPNGVGGLVLLAKHHPTLQGALVDFLGSLPKDRIGAWVTMGWGNVFRDPTAVARLEKLHQEWESAPNNPTLASAIKASKSLPKKAKG